MRRLTAILAMAILLLLGAESTQVAMADETCLVLRVDLIGGRIEPLPPTHLSCDQRLPVPAFVRQGPDTLVTTEKEPPLPASRFDQYYWWEYSSGLGGYWTLVLAESAEQVRNGTARRIPMMANSQRANVTEEKAIIITTGMKIQLNGQTLDLMPGPYIENNRTMVPMRGIFEAMGASVEWEGDSQRVTARRDGVSVSLVIGSTQAWVSGREVALDVPATLSEDRTFVPLRFIAEAFGAEVTWDEQAYTVFIEDRR